MIANIKGNIMGTVSFDGKFAGMRKAQDFIVYPLKKSDLLKVEYVEIQSDTRFGKIDVASGKVYLSKAKAGGAYAMDLALTGALADKLDAEELLMLKAAVMGDANENAGKNGLVYCDNGGAAAIFGE